MNDTETIDSTNEKDNDNDDDDDDGGDNDDDDCRQNVNMMKIVIIYHNIALFCH